MPTFIARFRAGALLLTLGLASCFSRVPAANDTAGRSPLSVGALTLAGPGNGGALLHFAFGGDEGNAGTIDYRRFDPSALSIVGAGAASTNRTVRVFDDLIVSGKTRISGTSATVTAGAGAPSAKEPNSSLYLRTDGKTGQRLCVSAGAGIWHCVPGV